MAKIELSNHALLAISVVRLSAAIQLAAIKAGIFIWQSDREPTVDGLISLVEELGRGTAILGGMADADSRDSFRLDQ